MRRRHRVPVCGVLGGCVATRAHDRRIVALQTRCASSGAGAGAAPAAPMVHHLSPPCPRLL